MPDNDSAAAFGKAMTSRAYWDSLRAIIARQLKDRPGQPLGCGRGTQAGGSIGGEFLHDLVGRAGERWQRIAFEIVLRAWDRCRHIHRPI